MAPRNQSAAAWTAGSSNTQDNDDIDPQEALATTQAKILLIQQQAQQIPLPLEQSLETLQLVTVLETLFQCFAKSPKSPAPPKQSTKIIDLPLLIDRQDPTFENWKL